MERRGLNSILSWRDHFDARPQSRISSFGTRDGAEEEIGDEEEDACAGCCE